MSFDLPPQGVLAPDVQIERSADTGYGLPEKRAWPLLSLSFTTTDERRFPFERGGCFPSGTRVWTDKGLVPIEQIKVGDMVLSQPESGGARTYKKVVNTFVHEDKTLREITYRVEGGVDAYVLRSTANHPFWVVAEEIFDEEHDDGSDEEVVHREVIGWTQADDLLAGLHLIQLADGTYARVLSNIPVYRTNTPGFGWSPYRERGVVGRIKDYLNNVNIADNSPEDQEITWSDDPYLKVRVYNFEVADFHTYYVGGGGVWVHNANCEVVKLYDNKNNLVAELPPLNTKLFQSGTELAHTLAQKGAKRGRISAPANAFGPHLAESGVQRYFLQAVKYAASRNSPSASPGSACRRHGDHRRCADQRSQHPCRRIKIGQRKFS